VAGVMVERMGGQGYLTINRVGEGIGSGHSGITAEGDNSVLMQKVVKELMTDFQSGKLKVPELTECPKREIPKLEEVTRVETILNLLKWREISQMNELAKITAEKVGQGKSIYEIWTREHNDLIQSLAIAYGERVVFEKAAADILSVKKSIQEPLGVVLLMFGAQLLKKDLAWFVVSGSISVSAAKALEVRYRELVKMMHPFAYEMVNSFGIPEELLTAPVAKDYVEFNKLPWTNDTLKSSSAKPKL